jgi:hypothetical protein
MWFGYAGASHQFKDLPAGTRELATSRVCGGRPKRGLHPGKRNAAEIVVAERIGLETATHVRNIRTHCVS